MRVSFKDSNPATRVPDGDPDAMVVGEVDSLVSKLLTEIKLPFSSLSKHVLAQLADLKKILAADYRAAALPPKPLLKELARIVDREINSNAVLWRRLADTPGLLGHFGKLFGPREIELRAEPYRHGAGLALRGFFCRAAGGGKSKFVIFVNTAHHPVRSRRRWGMNWGITSMVR